VKGDDRLGKCFQPQCGQFLTSGCDNGQYRAGLTRVLELVYYDCHQDLLQLATGQRNAYTYLRDERGIHPQVIEQAMLGAVPSGYDVARHFQPVIAEAQDALTALHNQKRRRPTKQLEQAEKRLQDLQEAQQKLVACLAHKAGWLMFFYTNAAHQPVAIRLRQPYEKQFVSFKPGRAGLFGRELFTPYTSSANQYLNDFLVIVEGEFNVLQLQSLTVRYAEAIGQPAAQCYHHACAVGGVQTADIDTLKRVTTHPVIVYDHDKNQAGFELVRRVQTAMPVEACTTPLDRGSKSDLDSYICDFDQDHTAAWEGVKALIADRQSYGRVYAGTGEEFFDVPISGKTKVFMAKLLADALRGRQQYRFTDPTLWIYRDGVYVRDEGTIHSECLALLGSEWTSRRRDEAIAYTQDAERLDVGTDTHPHYLNVRNDLYDLTQGTLGQHTPTHFSTVQLPMHYDPDARCPGILAWLKETTQGDDAIIQVLRAYLKAIVQGDTQIQRILELIGPGGSGKGTYLRLAQALVGLENTMVTELKHLETSRFELAGIRWKRLICVTDADRYGGPISNLKAITGGDMLRMEEKFIQGRQDRTADGLVLIAANEEIQSSDYTSGLGRRRLTIYFTHVPAVPRDLLSIHGRTFHGAFVPELPGLLNWGLDMPDVTMHELLSLDHQMETPGLREHWRQTLLATNPLAEWAQTHLILDPDAITKVGTVEKFDLTTTTRDPSGDKSTAIRETYYKNAETWLYPNYVEHAHQVGSKPMALKRFTAALHDFLTQQVRAKDISHGVDRYGSRFHGVRLRTAHDDVEGIPLLLESENERDIPF
jgi:phage/plasmid-associated DNA primase